MAKKKSKQSREKKDPSEKNSVQPPSPDSEEFRRSGFALKDELVEEALVTGEHRDLLESYFGEGLYQEMRTLTTRARSASTRGGPRVLLLPGIMGSKLGVDRFSIFDDVLWVDPIDIIAGRLRHLALGTGSSDISPLGVLLIYYLKLKLKLRLAGLDVSFHPFDWRLDIREAGTLLADRIRQETKGGLREVHLVGHSMGGLVARAAYHQLEEQGDQTKIRQLIMLGTPNFGSFAPVTALSGNHSLVKKVAALDLKHSEVELGNKIFNTFPGLYQLLPAPQKYSGLDLAKLSNWPQGGPVPRTELLAQASQLHDGLASGGDNFILIAGVNRETIVDVQLEDNRFHFFTTFEGDGTVPLAFAELEGAETYYIEEEHSNLPNNGLLGDAVIELVETGSTDLLATTWQPDRRAAPKRVAAEALAPEPFDGREGEQVSDSEIRNLLEGFASPPAQSFERPVAARPATAVISNEPIIVGRRRQQRIDVRLACGSITQVDNRAIVLGLFRGVAPSGAARAIDRQLDGVVSEFAQRRIMSAEVGEVFIMPANRYRLGADFVLFAGLGAYDDFNEEVLRLVAENVARTLVRTRVDDFASVMMSSGSGMSTELVLTNLMKGFIRGLGEGDRQGRLRSITLCEYDPRRFDEMHREILKLAASPLFDDVEATVEVEHLPPVPAAPVPSRVAYPEADPAYLIVREVTSSLMEPTDPSLTADFTLRASVLTAGSKATVVTDTIEIKGAALNRHLEGIEKQGFSFKSLDSFGEALGQMVLPSMVRKALLGNRGRQLMVIHDARTSRIPWETLKIEDWSPAASEGLSRKYEAEHMAVARWLEERRLAQVLNVLLIVNPTEDLDGADKEGDRIKEILAGDSTMRVSELRRSAATFSAVRAAFRSGKYDVVHYAGHAFFDPINRSRSGLVCHQDRVLSGIDLGMLENLPSMVFFNACEAGRVRSAKVRKEGRETAKRLETNVGLAESLLRAGVGNYIGTYWPVGDTPAKTFGEVFYSGLVGGETVGRALNQGRSAVRDLKSVDWADYVHYGSPSFLVKRRG